MQEAGLVDVHGVEEGQGLLELVSAPLLGPLEQVTCQSDSSM